MLLETLMLLRYYSCFHLFWDFVDGCCFIKCLKLIHILFGIKMYYK